MKTVKIFFAAFLFLMFTLPAMAQTFTPRYSSLGSRTNGYYEYLPEGYDAAASTTYPLILFMTGIGEFGDGSASQLPNVLKNGLPKVINNGAFPKSFTVGGQVFKFIVIIPQFIKYPRATADDMESVLNYVVTHYKVDVNRIYITGLSYGGGLSWAYAGANNTYSKRVAAIVPVANPEPEGGDTTIYARSRVIAANNVAVWATHNLRDQDDTVATTIAYVNDVNQPPAPTPPAKMTLFDAGGHDAWTKTYNPAFKENGMNVYEWMLQYQRGSVATNQPPKAMAGADQAITLPANSVTLNGSGTDADGSIAAFKWTQVSGPTTATIASPNAATTTVSGLAQGSYVFRLTVTDNKGATGTGDVTITVNAAPNVAPHANAGPDQTITLPDNNATLTGSGTDNDGRITAYAWTKVSGPQGGSITTPNAASTTITALQKGTYVFQLTVTDNDNATATDDVTITVNAAPNQPPTANAGTNQTITLPVNSVTLTGKGTDTDGSISSYAWSKVSGPAAGTITNAAAATTTVTGLVEGTYTFRLTVTDNDNATATDDVTVVVLPAPNKAPAVNAGADQTITLPANSITLNGSATDADGTIAQYTWTKVEGPAGSTITPADAAKTTVSSLVQGQYVFRLTVKDNDGATAFDDVTVTVNSAANKAPVAHAGADVVITLPVAKVALAGSGTDADGSIAKYVWTKVSGPAGSVISSANAATTEVTGLVQGVYVFRLTVTDNDDATAWDEVTVTVNAAPNQAPVANAGADQTITLPVNTVTLHGSGTDADGTIAGYQWTKVSGPDGGDLSTPRADSTVVTGLLQGSYVFRLTVTDNKGATATDNVKVEVSVVTAVGDSVDVLAYRIMVAPNPSTTYFSLRFSSPSAKPAYLRISDALGRAVEERSNIQRNSRLMVGQQYRPGVYYAEVVQGGKRVSIRLLKLK